MQLDSTLEMSLEKSTDTLPHTGFDQTADQSDLPDRNGLRIVRIRLFPTLISKVKCRPLASTIYQTVPNYSNLFLGKIS